MPKSILRLLTVVLGLVTIAVSFSLQAAQANAQAVRKQRLNRAFAKVNDDPNLPRVLLIGDSISIGYTVATQQLLKRKANVHRIPTNGGPTTRGLKNIEKWLGNGRWDVIHFNWGLHDLKYLEGEKQVPLDDYRQNLQKLVKRLKETRATLIWCSTTPVPAGVSPARKNEDVIEYNGVAAKIMKENEISTDELYTFAEKQLEGIQRPNNVHFTPAGSKVLAGQVARSILAALKTR